jgi:hypothetical protein
MVGVLQCLLIQRGRQENVHRQAKRSKPDQSPGGTEWQTGSWSRQAEWSGRWVQSPETGKGQNPGGLEKGERKKQEYRKNTS